MARSRTITSTTALAAAIATLLVAVIPYLHFAYQAPQLHIALETTAALVALFAAYLVFGRFRRSRSLNDLLLVCALGLLAAVNLGFGALPAALASGQATPFSTWAALTGSLLGAVMLAAASFAPSRRLGPTRIPALATFTGAALALVSIAFIFSVLASDLPTVGAQQAPPEAWKLQLIGHPAVLTVQLVAMALFAMAAFGFTRSADRTRDELMLWLAAAAALGAFARLNYFLYPSLYSQWVYTGDAFRLLSYLVLLAGAFREIRRYWHSLAESAVLEERRRLARNLHDGLAQELAFLGRNLQRLDAQDAVVIRAKAASIRALAESRRAIAVLTQPLDEPLDVVLAAAAQDVAAREGGRIVLELDERVQVDVDRREALVRIACEAISNAVRHGRAPLVRVQLANGRRVRLRITDSGTGFDPEKTRRNGVGGYGLLSMRERAQSLGGEFRLVSAPGSGTEVEVLL
jgi:signal transduction histidine kinase